MTRVALIGTAAVLSALVAGHGSFRRYWQAVVGGYGGQSAGASTVRPAVIGLNMTGLDWYLNERPFANLMLGGHWQFGAAAGQGWSDLDPRFIDRRGDLTAIPPGGDVMRMLTRPNTGPGGAAFRCTYRGRGEITARGAASDVVTAPGEVRFRWTNRWDDTSVWLQIHAMDAGAPIAGLDCREASLRARTRFAPGYVEALRGYRVLRFAGWQNVNANLPVTWATRHDAATLDIAGGDGAAVEDIAALATAVGAAPWVTVPWNADDDYITRFARIVHDGVPSDRPVYVELSNEVWNSIFPVSNQASAEGTARGLSRDVQEAGLLRYAQRTVEVMRLWERVFADRPRRLVRVASTFTLLPRTAETVLGAPDLPAHVDALATAPYFGGDLMRAGETADPDEIFDRLDQAVDVAIAQSVANRAVALRYGKRFLAYEAGQHVVLPNDLPLLARVQRDPRMFALYKRYIAAWRAQVGDTLMLFASAGPIGRSGAWGLSEYAGQPPSAAPKLRAALEERGR